MICIFCVWPIGGGLESSAAGLCHVNDADENGVTPIMLAASNGDEETYAHLLLRHDADDLCFMYLPDYNHHHHHSASTNDKCSINNDAFHMYLIAGKFATLTTPPLPSVEDQPREQPSPVTYRDYWDTRNDYISMKLTFVKHDFLTARDCFMKVTDDYYSTTQVIPTSHYPMLYCCIE